MKKYMKQKWMLAACTASLTLCAFGLVGVGAFAEETATEPEQTGKSLTEISFDMMKGASVRANPAGIRFSATMSKTDWDDLKLYYGEENITFGAFIMPAQYQTTKGEFTLENLFGDADSSPIFNWEVDGEYTPETGKTRIIQMDSAIYEDTEISAMRVNGSITEIADKNLALDFVGVCYIKAGDDYKLATLNDNERNIVYVAQVAMDKEPQYATELQKVITAYQTYYAAKNDGATPTVSYTVKTYLNDRLYDTAKYDTDLNTEITLAEPDNTTINGYTYLSERSETTGRALFGNKLVLTRYYHKKEGNALYDFYDNDEKSLIKRSSTKYYGSVVTFDGEQALKVDINDSVGTWGKLYLSTDVDAKLAAVPVAEGASALTVADVDYLYFDMYWQTEFVTGEKLRFTYYTTYTNGSWSGETNLDNKFSANTWITVKIPVASGITSLSQIPFLFLKQTYAGGSSLSWKTMGMVEGDAVYIREIGVISSTVSITPEFRGFENYADMERLFTIKNSDYKMSRNTNKQYIVDGNFSLKLTATPRWPEYYFSQEFIDWMDREGVKSFSFDVYIDSPECYVTRTEGISLNYSPKNNEWYTITIADVSSITTDSRIQFNKSAEVSLSIYLDNMQFTYAS